MGKKEEQIRIRKKSGEEKPKKQPKPSAAEEESSRSPRRKRRKRHLWWRLLLIALAVVLVVLVWQNWDTLNPESVWEWLTIQFTGGAAGEGYPFPLEGSTVLDMQPLGKQLALVTDREFLLLNSTAGETARRPLEFARPLLFVADDTALVCEVGGKRIRIENAHDTELEKTFSQTLVTATLAENGRFAVVTDSTGSHMSEVALYDKKGKELYRWYSSDLLVTGVTLNEDATEMAVCGVTARDGACESVLLVFDIPAGASAQPQRYSETEVMLCGVDYVNDETVLAIGDEALWLVNPATKSKKNVPYNSQELLQFCVSEGKTVMVRSHLGGTSGGLLTVLDAVGSVVYEQEFIGNFRDLAVGEEQVLLLTDRMLYRYDEMGARTDLPVASDGRMLVSNWNKALVLGLTELQCYE